MQANINYKKTNWLLILLAIILTLGVVFRWANIDKKIYWHDESYTTIRTTGYQAKEIADTIPDGTPDIVREFFADKNIPGFNLRSRRRVGRIWLE